MRPLVVLSISTAKRFIHSCWASLRVAVASLMVMDLSWAAAVPDKVATSAAARTNAPARTPDHDVMTSFIDSLPVLLAPRPLNDASVMRAASQCKADRLVAGRGAHYRHPSNMACRRVAPTSS